MRFGIGTVEDLTWKQMMDSFSCTECGRCQDACPAYATGKTLSPKLLIMGVRDHLFAEGPKALAARAGDEAYDGPPVAGDLGARGDGLGLRHVRRVRARVPGQHRARRPHRRPAPPPRDGRVALPERGRADAARRRAPVEPVGQAAGRARRVGGGPRRARARARRPGPGGPLLGRLRGLVRRARAARPRGRRRSCCRRRASTSRSSARARPATATRRAAWATSTSSRPTPSRTSRRSTRPACARSSRAARTASTRSPTSTRTSAGATRSSTTPSCSPSSCATGACRRPRASRRSPTTTPATSPATTTCSRSRASSPRPSASRSRWSAAASARSAAAPAARTCGWRSARKPINEERVREAAATGADTLAVACPFCTVMLDDGVQSTRRRHARRRRRDAARRGGRRAFGVAAPALGGCPRRHARRSGLSSSESSPTPFGFAMTKTLRLLKRHLRARSRWSPKQLEFGAIPA